MRTNKLMMMALLGSIMTFGACKKNTDSVTVIDKETFITQAGSGNLLEIQAGAMAKQRGQDAEVRAYGDHMVTDHAQASTELKAVADAKGIAMPTQLTAAHQQELTVLSPLNGQAFDKAFMTLMVNSHKEQVDLFQKATTRVTDADLRALAKAKLPTLQEHLTAAIALNAKINP
jgi:putative membrane protein